MHIVHKLRGKTLEESAAIKGGIAVLGVFLEIGPRNNPAFQPMIDSLQHIIYKSKPTLKTILEYVYLRDLR